MFVRKKQRKGSTYYYLVKSVREGGKVRQKTLLYLGEYATVEAALEGLPRDIERLRAKAGEWRAHPYNESCQRYWRKVAADNVRSYERMAREAETRLAKLKGVVGRNSRSVRPFVGTTECSGQKAVATPDEVLGATDVVGKASNTLLPGLGTTPSQPRKPEIIDVEWE